LAAYQTCALLADGDPRASKVTTERQSKYSSSAPDCGYVKDAITEQYVCIIAAHTSYKPGNGALGAAHSEDEEDVTGISCLE